MPPRVSLFTLSSGFAGSFARPGDSSDISANAAAGFVRFDLHTLFIGDKHVFGGIFLGRVSSDPDVGSLIVDLNVTFLEASGLAFGFGYFANFVNWGAGAVNLRTGVPMPAALTPIVVGSGYLPVPWEVRSGPLRLPFTLTRRFTLPKPPSPSTEPFLMTFHCDGSAGGGPAMETRTRGSFIVNSAVVTS